MSGGERLVTLSYSYSSSSSQVGSCSQPPKLPSAKFDLGAALRKSALCKQQREQQAARRSSARASNEINNFILRPASTVPLPPPQPALPSPPDAPCAEPASSPAHEERCSDNGDCGFRRWKHAKQVRSSGARTSKKKSDPVARPIPWLETPRPRTVTLDCPLPEDHLDPPGIVLMEHQRAVLRAMASQTSMLLAHCMGAGKTVTSLSAGSMLLGMGAVDRIVVLAPVSVQQYWLDTAARVLSPGDCRKVEIATHAGVSKLSSERVAKALLVVDEAHTFRTPIRGSGDRVDKGKMAKELLRVAASAARVMLLTGTPVVNRESDLRNLAAALDGVSWRAVPHMYRRGRALYDAFSGRVSMFGSVASESDAELAKRLGLPDCKLHTEEKFVMDREYNEAYERVINNDARALFGEGEAEADEEEEDGHGLSAAAAVAGDEEQPAKKKRRKDLSAFYNGERRATNRTAQRDSSVKLQWLEQKATEWCKAGERFVVFSAWKQFGAELVQQQLAERGVVAGIITGDVGAGTRAQLVAAFNEGRMHGLILTGAGSEGLDLRGVEHVVPLEPCWNWAKAAQAVARAVRIGSHDHLPPERRVVNVYRVVLRRQERSADEISRIEHDGEVSQEELAAMRLSADEKLMRFTNEKRALMLRVEAELRARSV